MDVAKVLLGLIVAGAILEPTELAAQSGWPGAPAAQPATSYDRYGQPITSGAPSITARAQGAFSETGTALRDGVEAGIRAAAEQTIGTVSRQAAAANPFAATTTPGTSGSTARGGVTSPWPTTPTATSAAPSWPTNSPAVGAATTRGAAGAMAINGGWTSIGTAIPAPPLLIPLSPMTTTSFGGSNNFAAASTMTGSNGPSFSTAAANDPQHFHSVLTDPSRSTTPASNPADAWASGWNNNSGGQPATIARTGSQPSLGSTVRESELVTLPSNTAAAPDPRGVTVGRANDAWTDTWTQSPPAAPAAAIGAAANNPAPYTGVGGPSLSSQPGGQLAGQANSQAPNSQTLGNFNTAATNPNSSQMGNGMNQGGRNQVGSNGTTEPQPWMPLIASVLTLAGSLAANLYLGVSYLDARQKYQSLVRKTAETFRRVKAVAA